MLIAPMVILTVIVTVVIHEHHLESWGLPVDAHHLGDAGGRRVV
jgi:hypothetical protein